MSTAIPQSFTTFDTHLSGYEHNGQVSEGDANTASAALGSLDSAMQSPSATPKSLEEAASDVIKANVQVVNDLKAAGNSQGVQQMESDLAGVLGDGAKKAHESMKQFSANATNDTDPSRGRASDKTLAALPGGSSGSIANLEARTLEEVTGGSGGSSAVAKNLASVLQEL